mmetsp:Transcript_31436/g.72280  ORF Transcript_31436/g.72280 Transcript_31436/m.72280 type:complete len:446 (+) Transcript_31436:100-1437(+)
MVHGVLLLALLATEGFAGWTCTRPLARTTSIYRASWYASPVGRRASPVGSLDARDGCELPRTLLLQTAIQAQLSYSVEFKNELMGRWLSSFMGHEHLRVARTGDYGSGAISFRGLDGGLRCSWSDYLRSMLSARPQEYEVRYKVGTADIGHWPKAPDGEEGAPATPKTADGSPAPWADASASRRNNPYLQNAEPVYRIYTEVIEPRRVARSLMQVREQLAGEWAADLRSIALEGEELRSWFCDQQFSSANFDKLCAPPSDIPVGGANDGFIAPDENTDGFIADIAAKGADAPAAAALALIFAIAKSCWSHMDSPFRASNYDLLQRAVTREASLRALRALSGENEATANWLKEQMETRLPVFEKPVRRFEGGHFLVELMAQGPAMRTAPDGSVSIIDPALAVDRLLEERLRIAVEWIAVLQGTADEHGELLRDDLTKQLNAQISTD